MADSLAVEPSPEKPWEKMRAWDGNNKKFHKSPNHGGYSGSYGLVEFLSNG